MPSRPRQVVPTPTAAAPFFSPYVDNLNFVGVGVDSVQKGLDQACRELPAFHLHEKEEADFAKEMVGVVFEGASRTLRPTHRPALPPWPRAPATCPE